MFKDIIIEFSGSSIGRELRWGREWKKQVEMYKVLAVIFELMFFLTKPENPTAACSLKGLLNKTHLQKRFAICKIKLDRQFDCFQKTYELVHLYCPGLPNWLCWWDLTFIEEQQLQLLMKNRSTVPALAEVGSVCSESPSSPCSSSGNVWKIPSVVHKLQTEKGRKF